MIEGLRYLHSTLTPKQRRVFWIMRPVWLGLAFALVGFPIARVFANKWVYVGVGCAILVCYGIGWMRLRPLLSETFEKLERLKAGDGTPPQRDG